MVLIRRKNHRRKRSRPLRLEGLEPRLALAVDLDDQFAEAVSLGPASSTTPKIVSASITPDTDVDLYSFSAGAGQIVDFDIDTPQNGPGGLGSYLRLFNSQGQLLAANNDGLAPGENQVGFDAYLRFTFSAAGTYFLGVSNANNTLYNPINGEGDTPGGSNATGNYQLTVQALPIDTDDTLAEATPLSPLSSNPVVVSASITPDIDVDLYSFQVGPGQVVDFDIDTPQNGPGGLGSYLRIFNSQGQQLAFNNDAAAPGESQVGFDAYLRFTFTTPGTYYVGVSNATNIVYNSVTGSNDTAGGLHSIGNYQLIVQNAVVSPPDPDDTIAEAVSLGSVSTTPITFNGIITPDTDVDLFRFTVTAGQVVDFDIDTPLNGPGGLGSYIRLFDALGQQLAFNNDALAPGESVVGFDAYLRFTFATAGTYFLGVSNANNKSYNPLTGAGDVAGGANATGNYTLIVQALPVDTDDATTEATALGPVTANPIIKSDAINPDIDVDLYSFTVTTGQVVDFDIDTPLNGPGGLGSFLRIFNSQGQQLAFNNDAAAPGESLGFDAYIRFTFASPGTYYVGVSNANNTLYNPLTGGGDAAGGPHSIGTYQLIVQSGPLSSGDPDDTIPEAVALGAAALAPTTFNASITPDIDVDMFSFTVTAGQVVDFDIDTPLNGPGGLGSYIRLFNAQGQQLAFNNDALAPGEDAVGFDAYLRFTFATAGTYYLGVSNANNTQYNALTGGNDTPGGPNSIGVYTLVMQALPIDTDDSTTEATSLGAITNNPAVVSAAIETDIDVDLYSFTVTAGQVVDFDIDTPLNGPGGLGSYIRIFNGQGQQIAFNNDGASPGEVLGFDSYLRFTFLTAGTYYVGVSNANNALYNPLTGANNTAGGPNSIGNYQLIAQSAAATTGDPDDTLAEAVSLGAISTTAATVNASITPDTDVDMYTFTVTAGQVVDFDIDTALNGPGGLGSYIRLFNVLGQLIASNNDAMAPGENVVGFDAYLRFTFASAGTYYLGVSNATNTFYNPSSGTGDAAGGPNATGSYTLIVQALPVDTDDAISEATALGAVSTNPATVSASISPDIDVDMYSFTVAAGQVVDFDIDTPLNGPGGLGSYLRIFNNQGQQLAFNNDAAAPGESTVGFDAYLRFTFTAAGTYFVGVSNANNTQYNALTGAQDNAGGLHSVGNYQLTVQTAVLAPPDADDTLTESFFLGAASVLPTTFNGSITPDTDVDMFRFSVVAGQTVDFDIDTPQNGPGGLGSFIRLFNATGQQLAVNNDALAPGESQLGFDAYLRFTFAAAGFYYLGVSNATNITYNPLTGVDDTAGGTNATGNYTLIMQALPTDTDDSTVEAIGLGPVSVSPPPLSGTINPDIDVDLYSFSVVAGQVVDFDIDTVQNGPGGLGSYLRLFNSQGQQLAFNNDAAAPGESQVGFDAYLRFTFNLGGTYYIGVSNHTNTQYNALTGGSDTSGGLHSIGNYQLFVQIAPTALVNSSLNQTPSLSARDAIFAELGTSLRKRALQL